MSLKQSFFIEEEFLGCGVLMLGPYSPMFNPIEQVWSLIKAYVRQELAAKIVSILQWRFYEIAEGFRFMPLSLVRLRTFQLST